MKITGINVDRMVLFVPPPDILSPEPDEFAEMFVLHLVTDQGTSGLGESGAFKMQLTAHYQDLLLELPQLPDLLPLPLSVTSPQQFYLDYLYQVASDTLRAALDLAVHDAFAQENGVSIFKLYEEELLASGDVDEQNEPVEYIKHLLRQQNPDLKSDEDRLAGRDAAGRKSVIDGMLSLMEQGMLTRESVLTYASSTDAFSVVESLFGVAPPSATLP